MAQIFITIIINQNSMKSILFSLSLLISSFAFAQTDVEESMDNLPLIDNSTSSVMYNVRGVYQIKDSGCGTGFESLKYPGGTNAFIKDLKEKMEQNVNWNSYAINGFFFIKMDVNKMGTISKIEAGPKVPNSELFLNDLKEATKKINKTWTPAKCNGKPIDSKAIIKIDFSSMTYDTAFN